MLVIAGSEVSFFRDDVLAGAMYGRRDGQLQLTPFDHHSAALFTPGYSAEDKVRTFAVCGGMPYYLARFSDERPLEQSILTNILYRDGFLHEEADLLLRQELHGEENLLTQLETFVPGAENVRRHYLCSRSGFTEQMRRLARAQPERIRLVTPRDVYDATS